MDDDKIKPLSEVYRILIYLALLIAVEYFLKSTILYPLATVANIVFMSFCSLLALTISAKIKGWRWSFLMIAKIYIAIIVVDLAIVLAFWIIYLGGALMQGIRADR